MMKLLRHADYSDAENAHGNVVATKHYQRIEMLRHVEAFDKEGANVADIGPKRAFMVLDAFRRARRFVIEPYNGAAGNGLTGMPPSLPYPMALFRCLVGPDSHIIPDAFFDLTFSISVLEHIGQVETGNDFRPVSSPPPEQEAPRDQFCQELFRITKPGGVTIHTIDHAARNVTYLTNFQNAGFVLIDDARTPSVDDCLHDAGAVRQRVKWGRADEPMDPEQLPFHSVILLAMRRPPVMRKVRF